MTGEAAWTAPQPSPDITAPSLAKSSINNFLFNPDKLQIPIECVSLKEIHAGKSGKLFIQIEDAHANLSGQQNLARALEHFMERYDLRLVLVEGASRDATLDPVKPLLPRSDWPAIARKFLFDGVISGEEYLNLTSDLPMRIRGVEYRGLYDDAVRAYAALVDRREDILHYLYRAKTAVSRLKEKFYPDLLKEYEMKTVTADNEDDSVVGHNDALLELARSARVTLDRYPETRAFVGIKQREAGFDFERLNRVQGALLEGISARGANAFAESFAKRARKSSALPLERCAAIEELIAEASRRGVGTDGLEGLWAYAAYLKEFSGLRMDRLFGEMEALEDEAFGALLKDDSGKITRAIDRFLGLLGKAYRLKMDSNDYRLLKRNEPEFKTESWLAFLNRELVRAGFFENMMPLRPYLEEARSDLTRFYTLVEKRDSAFVENARRIMTEENQKAAVLIAGGYHTANLTRLLRAEDASYVVLTPVVTDKTDQAKYEKLLLAHLKAEEGRLKPRPGGGEGRTQEAMPVKIPRGLGLMKLVEAFAGKTTYNPLARYGAAVAPLVAELRRLAMLGENSEKPPAAAQPAEPPAKTTATPPAAAGHKYRPKYLPYAGASGAQPRTAASRMSLPDQLAEEALKLVKTDFDAAGAGFTTASLGRLGRIGAESQGRVLTVVRRAPQANTSRLRVTVRNADGQVEYEALYQCTLGEGARVISVEKVGSTELRTATREVNPPLFDQVSAWLFAGKEFASAEEERKAPPSSPAAPAFAQSGPLGALLRNLEAARDPVTGHTLLEALIDRLFPGPSGLIQPELMQTVRSERFRELLLGDVLTGTVPLIPWDAAGVTPEPEAVQALFGCRYNPEVWNSIFERMADGRPAELAVLQERYQRAVRDAETKQDADYHNYLDPVVDAQAAYNLQVHKEADDVKKVQAEELADDPARIQAIRAQKDALREQVLAECQKIIDDEKGFFDGERMTEILGEAHRDALNPRILIDGGALAAGIVDLVRRHLDQVTQARRARPDGNIDGRDYEAELRIYGDLLRQMAPEEPGAGSRLSQADIAERNLLQGARLPSRQVGLAALERAISAAVVEACRVGGPLAVGDVVPVEDPAGDGISSPRIAQKSGALFLQGAAGEELALQRSSASAPRSSVDPDEAAFRNGTQKASGLYETALTLLKDSEFAAGGVSCRVILAASSLPEDREALLGNLRLVYRQFRLAQRSGPAPKALSIAGDSAAFESSMKDLAVFLGQKNAAEVPELADPDGAFEGFLRMLRAEPMSAILDRHQKESPDSRLVFIGTTDQFDVELGASSEFLNRSADNGVSFLPVQNAAQNGVLNIPDLWAAAVAASRLASMKPEEEAALSPDLMGRVVSFFRRLYFASMSKDEIRGAIGRIARARRQDLSWFKSIELPPVGKMSQAIFGAFVRTLKALESAA